jgi:preprotein translocase YajC subunit
MLYTLLLLAEGEQQAPWYASPLMILPLIALMFYFLILRPMRRQEAERQSLLSTLKKNDEVLLAPGIYGTVIGVDEKEDKVTVKIDDNCRIKVLKSVIARNLTNEKAYLEAQAKARAAAAQPAAGNSNAVTTAPKS